MSAQDSELKRDYGMTVADVEAMLAKQEGKCAICGDGIDMHTKRVDHSHVTGYVRGLLCNGCNAGIGMLKDSIEVLCRAVIYLNQPDTDFRAAKYN